MCVWYLVAVDAVVDRPGCLKILQHSLLDALRQVMDTYEVLEVFGSGVVLGPARVHPLDNGCYITKDQCMHQSCRCRKREQEMDKVEIDSGAVSEHKHE